MDTKNWRLTQGGEPGNETGDWRSQLQPGSRSRIVNKVMESLKRHLPVSGQEGLSELRKIAVRFEEKIYTAATSQSDYLRKLSLKILTMETKPEWGVPGSMETSLPSNPMVPSNEPLDSDSTAQTEQANGGNLQEEIYPKIKAMEELYFSELKEMYHKILLNLHQFDSLPQQPKLVEPLKKLKQFKTSLEQLLTFLQPSENNISIELKNETGHYEKQIVSFLNSSRPRNQISTTLLPGQHPASHMQSMQQSQSQMAPLQSPKNQINLQLHSANIQASLDSMTQNQIGSLGNGGGGDWQAEIYQKIKAMKELYYPELREMLNKILPKMGQLDSLPQQPKIKQLNKLKQHKAILERLLTFLQLSKNNIKIELKDRIGHYEKQIVSFLHFNRSKDRIATLLPPGQQHPASHMQFKHHSPNIRGEEDVDVKLGVKRVKTGYLEDNQSNWAERVTKWRKTPPRM